MAEILLLVLACMLLLVALRQILKVLAGVNSSRRSDTPWRTHRRHGVPPPPPDAGPMFLRGTPLYFWASDMAHRVVQKYLKNKPTASAPIDLSRDIHAEASLAMFPLGINQDERINPIPCPESGQGFIGITAPEALEVADYIRRHLPASERQRIWTIAVKNVAKLKNQRLEELNAVMPCPLQGPDHVCFAYTARPLRCRPLHAAKAWHERVAQRSVNQECDLDERIVEQGAEEGMRKALVAAGRDGNLYELNSALLVAMDTPDAAERWAKGEDVFGQCKRISS